LIFIGENLFTGWSPKDNKTMIILMIIFSIVIVIYLMNLLIGLLNMTIEADMDRASYLSQKAEVSKNTITMIFQDISLIILTKL